jgi:hypothetical protein
MSGPPQELTQGELPAEQYRHDDPELYHQVGRGELKGDSRGEVGPLAEDRAGEGYGGLGA